MLRQVLRHDADDLCVGREAVLLVLGIGDFAVDANVEDATFAADQSDLQSRFGLLYDPSRRTGARFIVSLAAIFDFDVHDLSP